MSKLEALAHPITTIRTAPFGFSLMAVNLVSPAVSLTEFAQNHEATALLPMTPSILGVYWAGGLIMRQFKLRDKVEARMGDGFNEEFLKKTTDEWCARQTVRTVLRDTEYLPAYEAICAEQAETAEHPRLPHF